MGHLLNYSISLHIQLNSFNLTSSNSEILIIWHLRVSQDWKFRILPEKCFVTETDRSLEHVQKGLQECLYIHRCGIFWPLAFNQHFEFWRHQKTKEDPEPVGEGDIQMEYSSNQLCSQNIGAVTKKYLLELRLVQVLSDSLVYLVIQHLSSPAWVGLMEFCCTCNKWRTW